MDMVESGGLVLVVNDDMDQLSSSMCDPSVDLPDARSQPYSLQHGLAPPPASRTPSPALPEIPAADLDLTLSFDSILGSDKSAEPQ